MVQIIECDLLECYCDVIIQSSNCQVVQGAGVAKVIRAKYPEVFVADQNNLLSPKEKLGTILPVLLHGEAPFYCFLNYNQLYYGRDKRYVDYEAFYTCLEKSKQKCLDLNCKIIGLPFLMSSVNGGGDWNVIYSMILSVFNDYLVAVIICKI